MTDKCDAERLPSTCIETTIFMATFQGVISYKVPQICPNSWPDPYVRALTSYPKIRCQVCSEPSITPDEDGGADIYTGELVFGPNQMDDIVTEDMISTYAVMKASRDGLIFGESLATVQKTGQVDAACCQSDTYRITLNRVNVLGAEKLAVVPIDVDGIMMPTGKLVDCIDFTTTTTSTTRSSKTHTTSSLSTTVSSTTLSSTATTTEMVNASFEEDPFANATTATTTMLFMQRGVTGGSYRAGGIGALKSCTLFAVLIGLLTR